MQLRHAVGARALVAHHRDEIAFEFTGVEQRQQVLLVAHHHRLGAHHPVLWLHRRDLDHAAAQIALQQAQATITAERFSDRAQHAGVCALFGHRAPGQGVAIEPGLVGVGRQALAHDGGHVAVQQASAQQFLHQVAHAACRVKVVHVGTAVGVDAGQQGHHAGEFGEIVPVDQHASCARHRHQVHGVVGRATGGHQADDGVDDGLLTDDVGEADGVAAGAPGVDHHAPHHFARERIAQRRAGVDERRARQVQTHDFHQHLVAVGGAIEGAGAGAVVGPRLAFQQGFAAHQTLGVLLAHLGLGVVREPGGHGAGGHKRGAEVAVLRGAHEQTGHDLVADAKEKRGVEHVV